MNDYLHQIAGEEFSAKDFRTWVATVLAAKSLSAVRALDTKKFAKKHLLESVEKVARQLGNTLTICRKSYIHPAIFDSYLDGSLSEHFLKQVRLRASRRKASLSADERCVLRLLQSRLRGTDRNRLERNLRASLTARA